MKAAVLLIVISFFGCQKVTSPVIVSETGEEFELEYGEQASVQGESITIQFYDVLADSRCPIGVVCVWAGNAKIGVQINNRRIDLNTYLEPKQAIFSDYKIELLSVSPYPEYKVDVEKKEYAARFLIIKR